MTGSSDGTRNAKPVAVFVHVFYPEVWDRIARRLEETLTAPFHLVVTAPPAIADRLDMPSSDRLLSAQMLPVENRGRDVRPFCHSLTLPIDFEIGLKLHTKRSLHRLDGADWGQTLVEALLPDGDRVRTLLDRMTGDPRLALVAPNGMLVSQKAWMSANKPAMRRLARRFSIDLESSLLRTPVFCAGTMFWFRRDALLPLVSTPVDDLFEKEAGQVDGTTAHAMERLIALLAESHGGVVTTFEGALSPSLPTSLDALREEARRLADRPNPFLTKPHGLSRLAASTPVVRDLYMALPVSWRRSLKRLLIPAKPES